MQDRAPSALRLVPKLALAAGFIMLGMGAVTAALVLRGDFLLSHAVVPDIGPLPSLFTVASFNLTQAALQISGGVAAIIAALGFRKRSGWSSKLMIAAMIFLIAYGIPGIVTALGSNLFMMAVIVIAISVLVLQFRAKAHFAKTAPTNSSTNGR